MAIKILIISGGNTQDYTAPFPLDLKHDGHTISLIKVAPLLVLFSIVHLCARSCAPGCARGCATRQ